MIRCAAGKRVVLSRFIRIMLAVGQHEPIVPSTPNMSPSRARSLYRKHGVPFEEAETVFDDPLSQTLLDTDHSEAEERYLEIGYSSRRPLLLVS